MAGFDIAINDDDILEGNETFTITIGSSSVAECRVSPAAGNATVKIVDDDSKFQYLLSMYIVPES